MASVSPPGRLAPAARGGLSEQHTRVANARWVLEQVRRHFEAWQVPGFTLKLPPALERFFAQSDDAAAVMLRAIENPSPADRDAMTRANRLVARELTRSKRYPVGTAFVHVTRAEAVPEILRTANYDALFDLRNPHDTPTLGLADATRVTGKAPLLSTKRLAEGANSGFGDVALVYDGDRLGRDLTEARGTEYNAHWTYPIALPNTALMAIQILRPVTPEQRAAIERALASMGYTVPVVGGGQTKA